MPDVDGFTIENGILKKYNGTESHVTIPKGVTDIGDSAFWGCGSLAEVTIPSSTISIGSSAFGSCHSLTGVTVPEGVRRIGAYAFSHCENLTRVTIPKSVEYIGEAAFYGCKMLKTLRVNKDNPVYCSASGLLLADGGKTLIFCPAKTTDAVIPDSVTHIGKGAFENCDRLKTVTIPSSVTDIDHYAFVDTRYGSVVRIDRSRSIVIIGEKDSYAKQFALGRGIAFKAKRLRK